MSPITTHVLDTAKGRPARGLGVRLEVRTANGRFRILARRKTDASGRVMDLVEGDLARGVYRLTFDTAAYFCTAKVKGFYPSVSILFDVEDPKEHYHVPLLLSPFGFSTYRGS